jgi:hypothetical protein
MTGSISHRRTQEGQRFLETETADAMRLLG